MVFMADTRETTKRATENAFKISVAFERKNIYDNA
jgi:hypothetical protein